MVLNSGEQRAGKSKLSLNKDKASAVTLLLCVFQSELLASGMCFLESLESQEKRHPWEHYNILHGKGDVKQNWQKKE